MKRLTKGQPPRPGRHVVTGRPRDDQGWAQRRVVNYFHAVVSAWQHRTFPDANSNSIFTHFLKEVNELHNALLNPTPPHNIAEEAADCYLLLIALADHQGFDLELAAEQKMTVNRNRTWTDQGGGHLEYVRDQAS